MAILNLKRSSTRIWSMKKRLIIGLLVLLIPLRLLMGYLSLVRTEASTIRAFDVGIEDNLRGLATLLRVRDNKLEFDATPQILSLLEHNTFDLIFYQILGPNGEYLGGNATLPKPTDLHSEVSFSDQLLQQEEIRLGTLRGVIDINGKENSYFIQVGQTLRGRYHALNSTLMDFFETLILTSLLIIAVVLWCVRKSLMPLDILTQDLIRRGPLDLRPLDQNQVVVELRPLVQAFNSLLARLDTDMSVQRRFLENAAHELKTPLAALKTQIELALRETNQNKRSSLLAEIMVGVNRTSNLSKKLLAVSDASALKARLKYFVPCDLVGIAKDVIMAYLPEATAKGIDLGFDGEANAVTVMGDASSLYEMIANLVENAIRYSHSGGRVSVLVNDDFNPSLSVVDDGRGIPNELHDRVFERFFRILGTKVEGSGLGLAIVKEIVESHDATIAIQSGIGKTGTTINITFKAALFPQEKYGTRKSLHTDC